jgi:hypothetical protein
MVHTSLWSLKNRMLELSTSGSVGGAVGNHCFYPAADRLIEAPIAAGLVYVSYQFLSGMPFYPAAADAPSVSRRSKM